MENMQKLALRIHFRRQMNIARRKRRYDEQKTYSSLLADRDMFDAAFYAIKSENVVFGEDDIRRPLIDLLQFLVDNSDKILEILLRLLPLIISGLPLSTQEEEEITEAIVASELAETEE